MWVLIMVALLTAVILIAVCDVRKDSAEKLEEELKRIARKEDEKNGNIME